MEGKRNEILRKLEGYLKFRGMTKAELSKKWEKTEAYIYRRFSGEVELSLTDILELSKILHLSKEEATDIFFN